MADPVWGELPKSQADASTVDDEIDAKIDAHNADSEAHLGTDEAIEQHRTNDIIDHPAESIPNDKTFVRTRSYVAIVDPSTGEDFDTLASAVAYAITKGGGTIFIAAGTHNLSEKLELPVSVNLRGEDIDNTIIVTDHSTGKYIELQQDTEEGQVSWNCQELTFEASGGPALETEVFSTTSPLRLNINDCRFEGGGTYILCVVEKLIIQNCVFECSTDYALMVDQDVVIRDCTFIRYSTTASALAAISYSDEIAANGIYYIVNCRFESGGATACQWLDITTLNTLRLIDCFLEDMGNVFAAGNDTMIRGNRFTFTSTNALNFDSGDKITILGNIFEGGTGNKLKFDESQDCIIANNIVENGITEGTKAGTIFVNNVIS